MRIDIIKGVLWYHTKGKPITVVTKEDARELIQAYRAEVVSTLKEDSDVLQVCEDIDNNVIHLGIYNYAQKLVSGSNVILQEQMCTQREQPSIIKEGKLEVKMIPNKIDRETGKVLPHIRNISKSEALKQRRTARKKRASYTQENK